MIKIILPFVFLILISCEKEAEEEFMYDYKISCSYTIDNVYGDNFIFYYANTHRLLRVDRFWSTDSYNRYYVEYSKPI